MANSKIFKKCSFCLKQWPNRNSFLSDPSIRIIGYTANFENLKLGILFFNHRKNNCETTMGIKAGKFVDLYKGEIFQVRNTKLEGCPKYCFRKFDLRPCPAKCECASIREIIQIIKSWPKK
jgi:hypothetical protein